MAKLIGYLILTTLFSGLFYLTCLSNNIALVYVGCLTLGLYVIYK